jgi:cyclopropane-fatty-acyl-phospholipid synthase
MTPEDTLETAQRQKMLHIAAKLQLDRPGLRVLDIGSGWGGLACCLAAQAGCDVTGVTLSAAQHSESQASAQRAGLESQVRFHLKDYREMRGQYDRIVSVGMFEHVGRSGYLEFFSSLRRLLREDGVALLHAIGDSASPSPINPFIQKYIFPGAAVPSLSEVLAAVERSGLVATDIEILRLHYAETLACWRERFVAANAEVVRLYGEWLFRTWEFYFALCEVGFRHRTSMVFQLQLARRNDTLPITRNYMV